MNDNMNINNMNEDSGKSLEQSFGDPFDQQKLFSHFETFETFDGSSLEQQNQ